jgi:hypothetical protein
MILEAKQAAVSHYRIAFELIPVSYAKNTIKNKTIELWNQRWIGSTTGRQTKAFFPTIDDRKALRKDFVYDFKLTQIMTNHGSFFLIKRINILWIHSNA